MLFQNPNYVPATLKGMVMTMFHEDSAGEEAPFGVVTFSGDAAARLPARGSAIVDAQVRTCTKHRNNSLSKHLGPTAVLNFGNKTMYLW